MARLRTCSCWCAINCATVNGYKSANLHHKEVLGVRKFFWDQIGRLSVEEVGVHFVVPGRGWSDLEVLRVDGLDGRHPDRWRCVRPLLSFVSGLPHTLSPPFPIYHSRNSLSLSMSNPFSLLRIPDWCDLADYSPPSLHV